MLGVDDKAVCSDCHYAGGASKAYAVSAAMRSLADSLEEVRETAQLLVGEAEQKGMEVSEEQFKLRDVRQAQIESRTAVHSFSLEEYRAVIDRGLAASADVNREAKEAIDEYYFRRIGLGVSTLIITVLGLALYLKIRRIDRNSR